MGQLASELHIISGYLEFEYREAPDARWIIFPMYLVNFTNWKYNNKQKEAVDGPLIYKKSPF